jgi:hypothetical protein
MEVSLPDPVLSKEKLMSQTSPPASAASTEAVQPAYETNDMPAIETRSGVLYLECEAGFLPKTKVPIVNGVANFNWVALGLNSGDVGLVKVGFKYFSHKTSASVEVV